MLWFTSDTHFNHEKIVELSSRPFTCLEEMTEAIVSRWNDRVSKSDTIYHLGDFALSWGKKHAGLCDDLLSRLNGQKWLIVGNHDREEVTNNKRWVSVKDYHEIKLDMGVIHRQRIVLCHYALRVWNQSHRGAWMLHGHSHGNLVDIGGKTLDVGVDVHGYAPVSIEAVKAFMDGRTVVECDHHSSM